MVHRDRSQAGHRTGGRRDRFGDGVAQPSQNFQNGFE